MKISLTEDEAEMVLYALEAFIEDLSATPDDVSAEIAADLTSVMQKINKAGVNISEKRAA